MDYRLGLDIGIASVGWAIIDEDDNIVDAGVRLFPEGGKAGNETRRSNRGARRLLRRRAFRNTRAKRLLFDYKIIDSLDYDFYINETTPYHIRKKGIYEKLEDRELAIAMLHLVKRRGIHNVEEDEKVDEKKGEKSTKNVITENSILLDDRYVCELQVERLENGEIDLNNGSVRGVNNRFKTADYIKEAKKILDVQREYNNKIDGKFIEKYIKILADRREYYDGPGEPSEYGWEDEIEWMEKLVGKCTYFPEEMRLVKKSYTSELFNLLNDLNNLTIMREENIKLYKEEKENIIGLFKKNKSVSLKKIAGEIGVKEEDISGYRIDPKKNPLFTKLESFNDIFKILNIDDRDLFDEISKILTYYQQKEDKQEKLLELFKEKCLEFREGEVMLLSELPNYTGTHSLSKKAMNNIMKDLMETNKNQMELFTERKLVPYKMDFRGRVSIPKKYIEEWILSPVVKRSMGQTINVINRVMKKYGIPKEIVIELAREKNSDDKKRILQDIQKRNKDINDKVMEILEGRNKVGKGLFEKIKFWLIQDGKCMYSLSEIKIEELLAYPDNFEVDHILPRSISFDDSQSNKVLVKRVENQNKENMTPYEYFKSGKASMGYDEYKSKILINQNIDKRKRENLLFEGELSKYASKFIARNLVDTRYATRELMNMLKKFYKDNEKDVKIKSINGSFTSQIRKQWRMVKDRELSHVHHAQDALIVLMGERVANKLRWVQEFRDGSGDKYHVKTGEIIDDEEYKRLFSEEYRKKVIRYDKFRFSYMVDKKPNRQLSNETIYGTRIVEEVEKKGKKEVVVKNEYIISKLGNLYDEKDETIKKYFSDEKKKTQLLMYHHDKKTLEKFEKIYEEYKKEKNPFAEYKKEHGFIRKYAKKDNGPIVKELKYRQSKLGNCLDLSHKYNTKDRRVVMLSLPSYRADFFKKGDVYKFVSVPYLMLKDRGKEYEVDEKEYREAMEKKGVDDTFEFLFSVYRGDVLEIEKADGELEKVRFKGVNNDDRNYCEFDWLDRNYLTYINSLKELEKLVKENSDYDPTEKMNIITGGSYTFLNSKEFLASIPKSSGQKIITIGKGVKKIRKLYVDVLGYEYNGKEEFKSIIKK